MDCQCGKRGYSKVEAQTVRNSQLRRGNARNLEVYPCSKSNYKYWHVSHTRFVGFGDNGKRIRK